MASHHNSVHVMPELSEICCINLETESISHTTNDLSGASGVSTNTYQILDKCSNDPCWMV